jgi:LPS export ABC transporter permease LptF
MRIVGRYICREVFSYALLGLAVFTFVFFVPQLVRLMEIIVRHSAGAGDIAQLFLCTLPPVLTFTLPMAVLVGVLIGLGRMSADSEIIALHALGIGLRRLLVPVGALALSATLLTAAMTFWLGPAALRTFRTLEEKLRASQASLQLQPRVFDERFPRLVLYVQDVDAGGTRWSGVLLAGDAADAAAAARGRTDDADASSARAAGAGTRITLAEQAVILAGPGPRDKVQIHLRNGSTHEYKRTEPERYSLSTFGESDLAISLTRAAGPRNGRGSVLERPVRDLLAAQGAARNEARVEFHRRLAFPAACIVFALLGVPVGVRPHRGGRAAGFLITLLLICAYYLLFVAGAGLARRGVVPAALGIWAANLLVLAGGIVLLPRMEEISLAGPLERWRELIGGWMHRPSPPAAAATPVESAPAMEAPAPRVARTSVTHGGMLRTGGLALLMDLYVLRHFFTYLAGMLAGFILIFQAFTFFELLNDIARNAVPAAVLASYFLHLTPHLCYQLLPLGALVATLATLGAMSKHNELVAFCASGVSLYRLSLPLLLAGALLGGAMFLLDDTYLPYANQRQDALRNQIKGRPAQTFYQPRRQWIFGEAPAAQPSAISSQPSAFSTQLSAVSSGSTPAPRNLSPEIRSLSSPSPLPSLLSPSSRARLYNYDLFDPDRNLFGGLHLLELDPASFQIVRRVYAARAHWEENLQTWVLEEGWVREFSGSQVTRYEPFRVIALDEMREPPSYFKREVRQYYQMNWRELRTYIRELQQAGFDTARLSVQWHKKFAFPIITPVIILLAVPFALLVGTRGAIGGLALGVGIAIVYWAAAALLEALGAVGQLPPFVAGWAPDAIFALLGLRFFLKMQT